jgi:hypothetical protein
MLIKLYAIFDIYKQEKYTHIYYILYIYSHFGKAFTTWRSLRRERRKTEKNKVMITLRM